MRYLVPLFFMLIFLAIVSTSVIYLSRRMNFYFGTESIKYWYILFASMPVIMIVGMAVFSNSTNIFGSTIYQLAAVVTGFILYFLMTVLVIDFLHLFIRMPLKIYGFSSFIVAGLIVVYGVWNAFNIKITHINIPIEGLQKEFRLVHLSDVHIGHFRGVKFMQKVVDMSIAQKPDAVFITGDLFDGRINLTEESLSPLTLFEVPVFFVEGNHDGYTGVKTIKKYLRNIDVHVLENEVEMLGEIQIVGLNHMHADGQRRNMHANGGATIKGTLDTLAIDRKVPAILLHHSPEGAKYADEHGIDLYLSGHTHAGQIFPVNLLNELIFPFNRGLNKYNNLNMFVSEGVGTFGPPMRIGTKSEVVVFKLVPAGK